jgi:hypothetical protein
MSARKPPPPLRIMSAMETEAIFMGLLGGRLKVEAVGPIVAAASMLDATLDRLERSLAEERYDETATAEYIARRRELKRVLSHFAFLFDQ